MTALPELLKGLTDLPLALLAAAFALSLHGKRRTAWARLFWEICAAALLGVAAHSFALPPAAHLALWLVLYALLFACVCGFDARLSTVILGGAPAGRAMRCAALCGYLAAAVTLLLRCGWDIYFLVAYAAAAFCRLFVCLARRHFRPCAVLWLLLLLLAPIALQAAAAVLPFAVVAEHLVLLAALCFVYRIALRDG